MSAPHTHAAPPAWLVFIAARWKAVVAFVVPLVGGIISLSAANELDLTHVWGVLVVALASCGAVHATPNQDLAGPAAETSLPTGA